MRQKKVKPARQVVVIARVQWKRENTVCYIVRADKPLKEGEYEDHGLHRGDITINGQNYGSVIRDGQRYALYNVAFRDGVCTGCCCEASGYGQVCYHRKQLMLIEGKRQDLQSWQEWQDELSPVVADDTSDEVVAMVAQLAHEDAVSSLPSVPDVQTVETTQTITEVTSPIVDLDEMVAQLEKEYAPVAAASEKLPSATETVTKNITSGRSIDIGTLGSLSSNRQASAAPIIHRNMTNIERSLPSFMKR